MASERLPRAQGSLTDAAGHPLPEWYDYWRMIGEALDVAESDAERIAILEAAVAALQQAGESVSVTGPASVSVFGSSADGYVVQLDGDDPGPAASHYYGTDPDGAKGYHARLLATLADVDVTGLADGDLLRWDDAAERWSRQGLSDYIATLLDDADAATARSTLGVPAAVPTLIASGDAFTVSANTQSLWSDDIDIDGELVVLGSFIEVN